MNTISIGVIRRQQLRVKKLTEQFAVCMQTYHETRRATEKAALTELEAFQEVGAKLAQVKRELEHGEWLGWLESNFERTDRTAQRWMKASRYIGKHIDEWAKPTRVSDLPSIAAVMRLCGVNQQPSAAQDSAFNLAFVLRLIAPLRKLDVDKVCQLPAAEQLQLRARLEPVHNVYLALPAPADAS